MAVKFLAYLKFVAKLGNWQPPLPKPSEPEGPGNVRPRFDVLAWWDKYEETFPEVAAQHDLWNSCPPAEESCERMFSIVGSLLSIKRRNMDMECLADLVYINENWLSDPTVDFDIVKDFDPGVMPENKLAPTWEEFITAENEIVTDDLGTLADADQLDLVLDSDEEVDGEVDDSSSDEGPGQLVLPAGMRRS